MSLPINDQLDSIFGIPKDGSNIKEEADESQENSYVEVIIDNENVSFEQKAKKISDQLAKEDRTVDVVYVSTLEENKNVQPKQSAAVPVETKQSKDKFEEILVQAIRDKQLVSREVQPVVQEQTNTNKDAEPQEEDQDSLPTGNNIKTEEPVSVIYDQKMDEDGWYLVPPSPMFNHFYEEKSSLIKHITKNGRPIDIDKLTLELNNSNVSTNVELTDIKGMAERLTKIQDFLDRVVHIKIQATSQCVAAKRGVELLRGVLAKVSYEKPAIRQDGVIYDHMRDIEMYTSRLESLEQNAKDVYHNLLEAKETLSRKVSISFELLKEQNRTDGLEKHFSNLPDNIKKAVQIQPEITNRLANEGYDRLEVQEAVKNQASRAEKPMKKTGTIAWLE